MRTFDFAPLYRSTIGFDRFASLFDQAAGIDDGTGYPPYNIERTAETEYRISMAVAGFGRDEIKIELNGDTLTVTGEKAADDKARQFLHRGIAGRTFSRRFQLADHVEVKGADLRDGLLHLDLVRNVPERLKPRSIAIGPATATAQLEAAA
jgi:molecular chaperone IbpA